MQLTPLIAFHLVCAMGATAVVPVVKTLLPQLDATQFWQVHRGTVVRASAVACATRDAKGRLMLSLRERPEKLAVSRLYADRFKAM